VVVQQPVGLVGAQVVRVGQDVLVFADAPQPGGEVCDVSASILPSAPAGGVSAVVVSLGHHPGQHAGGLQ
jgi:hypothetical protein